MTDIDSMPAGAEMDRLVAERVMGWRYEHNSYWGKGSTVIFDPSRNISDAWRVVERMRDLGYAIRLYMPSAPGQIVNCSVDHRDGGPFIDSGGDSMPLAICRAALRAMA